MMNKDVYKFLEENWNDLRKSDDGFESLITLLKTHPITKNLMAFRQLFDLGLSRFIGNFNGIYINDLPRIRVTDEGKFRVMTPNQAMKGGDMNFSHDPKYCLGIGNAEEALEIIIKNLPKDIESAKFITEEDVIKRDSKRIERKLSKLKNKKK